MAHDSRAVANKILEIGHQKNIQMSMMKLIKLVYFSHAWSLGLTGKPFCSDPVEAWRYGPVFKDLYNSLPYKGSEMVSAPIKMPLGKAYSASFSEEACAIMEKVVDVYGNLTPFQLSDLTHQPGTPWSQTFNERGVFALIDNNLIRLFYEDKARTNEGKKERGKTSS